MDITTVQSGILLNGVNDQRVMGSGVARAYYSKWPTVKSDYMTVEKGIQNLGKVQMVPIVYGQLYVANCWTQHRYASGGEVIGTNKYARPDAIRTCLEVLCGEGGLLDPNSGINITEIYTPLIGCYRGGLDWNLDVLPEFHAIMKEYPQFNFTLCRIA